VAQMKKLKVENESGSNPVPLGGHASETSRGRPPHADRKH
jgi:hypothetical protein